ncbi:putative PTS IIA-like nitrogen-regulatory protein PtsN [Coriobacterium glomerans PW2]|uniref:PTS IIA-like nitrogen-regulatory protein PtsN n=1 Tax=Coriobacterium glomerans (strain ATCC 49209 / DSM 20642 / JCM 10262 / PW2) TaxID=700015 RepID=F2N7H1_CORGP|nr:PTS sugar transporter subunit IIA [Coriobacterium glomerans]AEB06787.1 putative PTS IIA-like nitrogen-regulatory protein PtsN [Coriobacterium glomerans PW2]
MTRTTKTLSQLIRRENVRISEVVLTWQEAIRLAVEPLVSGGFVEERYVDGIIANTYEFGPYYVLCPDLALLHARPEQGVIAQQLAITILRKPVRFKPEGPDVRLLVALAAKDADSHIEVMRRLAVLLSDPIKLEQIAMASTEDEAFGLFIGTPSTAEHQL